MIQASMDKRFKVIITILCCEILFRLAYQTFNLQTDPLVYTLLARLFELFIILDTAYGLSGLKARSLKTEILIGLGVSLAFGVAVLLVDLASRMAITGGILKTMLGRQEVQNPLFFFLVGCIIGPLVEELFFRGLFYSWLRQRLPIQISIILSTLAFASMHGFFSPIQLIGGLVFAALFEWRKNIWVPYIVHVAANTGIWVVPLVYPFW